MKLKKIILGTIVALGMVANTGILYARTKIIQVKGSDTILNLSQRISEEYMKENRKSRIAVTGGGSGVGISSLINGTTDIAMASRNIKDKELELAKNKNIDVKETVLGYDGITVIVNKDNKVKNISSEVLGKVYRGEVTNWQELGGENAPIVVLSRDSSSGTHEFFKEHIVRINNTKKDLEYGKKVLYMPSNEAIKQEIKSNKNAIGYIGMGYMDNTVSSLTVDNVEPSVKNVGNKQYPIAREVYWYSKNGAGQELDNFINFATSTKGQELVKQEGFVPVK